MVLIFTFLIISSTLLVSETQTTKPSQVSQFNMVAMKLLHSLGLVSMMMAGSALAVAVPSPDPLPDDTSPALPRDLTTDENKLEARRVSRIPKESAKQVDFLILL